MNNLVSKKSTPSHTESAKINAFEAFSDKTRLLTVSEVSPLFNMNRDDFYNWLKENKYLKDNNKPYDTFINQGLFDYIIDNDNYYVTLISGKGILYLQDKFEEKQ